MTASQKGRIFINYRRADSEGYAGRIYDRLAPHFGADAIFMDVEAIDAGVDFVKVLEEAVQSCDVLVALIGRRWLNLKDEGGNRRLDNPADFVRIEVAAALSRDIRVIPVLVGGAPMPGSADLPENLKPLIRRNALTVNHNTFHADMNRLIAHLERALQAAEASKVFKAKRTQEEQVRKERQNQVEKLLHQANIAINLSDWKLAQEKLKEILALDVKHVEAQAKLELVEEKLTAREEQKILENKEKEEARKRGEKQAQEAAAKAHTERLAREKAAAEEKARQSALRKERRRESIKSYKKFFANMGKLPYFIGGGIVLLFTLGYIISNIELPTKPEPTKTPTASIPATATGEPTGAPVPELGSPEYPIKVLFVPSVDIDFMISSGDLIAQALSDATGYIFEVSISTSYAATIEEMCASPNDTIGFIPAIGYVLANQLCGVQPGLAAERFGWNVYWTGFFVARDSEYQSLEDLAGATWAYPDAGSTSGFLYPSSIFADMGLEVGETIEAGGHPQSVLAVYNGQVDVATAFFIPPLLPEGTWAMTDDPDIPEDVVDSCAPNEEGRLLCGDYRVLDARSAVSGDAPDIVQQVRILTLSKEIPNDTMSFSPGFPDNLKQEILDAVTDFVSLDNPACADSLCNEKFYNWTAVGPIADENFDGVRILVAQQGITLESLGQ